MVKYKYKKIIFSDVTTVYQKVDIHNLRGGTMLTTPLGVIKVFLDDCEILCTCKKINSTNFPDVITYHLKYNHIFELSFHKLKCVLENPSIIGYRESGERLETVAFDSVDPFVRLSIGIDGEFLPYHLINGNLEPIYDYDYQYKGSILENGLEIELSNDESKEYIFSIAWMFDYNDDTAHKTWYMADPTYKK